MEKFKKSAVDLTDLAIGIVVLGIVVSIGATIVLSMRDSRLTELSTYSTTNETIDFSTGAADKILDNAWFNSITQVLNQTNSTGGASAPTVITSGNYTTTVDNYGHATVTNTSNLYPYQWKVTYSSYNTTRADYSVPDSAATGLTEYGNWFSILVIVGVAGLVLWLLFSAFGKNSQSGQSY